MDKNTFKFGFVKDKNNLQLNKIFENDKKLKEVYIDIYPSNPLKAQIPFVLLLRTHEKNIGVLNDGYRLVLKKNDRFETYIMDVLLSDINDCFVEAYDEHYSEFILNIQNIYYRITVRN